MKSIPSLVDCKEKLRESTPLDAFTDAIRSVVSGEFDRMRDELVEALAARQSKTLVDGTELCKILGTTDPTLRKLREDGLPYLRVGAVYRYDADEVVRWLSSRPEVGR